MPVKGVCDFDVGDELNNDLSLVWIVGHVLTGWEATQAQINPTNLCK
jgi:hypothetical protein